MTGDKGAIELDKIEPWHIYQARVRERAFFAEMAPSPALPREYREREKRQTAP
jgi:hypothetical protein